MRTRHVFGLIAAASATAAILLAPTASADPEDPTAPVCSTTGDGSPYSGTSSTECSTPGDVEITATAPVAEPVYTYPWDDEFYGPALIIGPGNGPHNGGGRGR